MARVRFADCERGTTPKDLFSEEKRLYPYEGNEKYRVPGIEE